MLRGLIRGVGGTYDRCLGEPIARVLGTGDIGDLMTGSHRADCIRLFSAYIGSAGGVAVGETRGGGDAGGARATLGSCNNHR